jgi:hypothetical protein
MAKSPNDFRDPHVTETKSKGTSMWIGIVVAIIAALILAWFLGLFGGNDVGTATVPVTTGSVIAPGADGAVVISE